MLSGLESRFLSQTLGHSAASRGLGQRGDTPDLRSPRGLARSEALRPLCARKAPPPEGLPRLRP